MTNYSEIKRQMEELHKIDCCARADIMAEIADYVRENGDIDMKKLANLTGLPIQAIRYYLDKTYQNNKNRMNKGFDIQLEEGSDKVFAKKREINKLKAYRKVDLQTYALIDESGNVDRNNTITVEQRKIYVTYLKERK
jgi:hypothetical protein